MLVNGEHHDITTLDGHVLVSEAWDASREADRYPASEMFATVTGWYPHEFEAICDALEARGVNCTLDVAG